MRRALLACLFLLAASPAATQTATPPSPPVPIAPSPALQARIDALATIINGTAAFDGYFAPLFTAQVSRAQFAQLSAQIVGEVGNAVKVESVTATSPHTATLRLAFVKGVANVWIAVDPAPPHAVTGLRITDIAPRGDSLDAVEAEIRALPGTKSLAIYALGDTLRPVREFAADTPLPIGSAFKLWVFAEATRQVKAGERAWRDVIPLGPRSLPSGATQAWPPGAPVTLHTLATLMVSISDNTATDTLMTSLGRQRVEAMIGMTGVADPTATLPLLTTIETLKLKAPVNADLAAQWRAAGAPGRRKLLADNAARIAATKVDAAMFGQRPLALDVEWFASARDIARTLDWLRVNGDDQVLPILAINPGAASAALFDYVGYKGGSEPGVVFGAWLVRTKQGNWYAVTGGWTRPDARVDERQFAGLMSRALSQIAPR